MNLIRQNKKILVLALLVAVMVLARFSRVGDVISIENVKKYRELLLTAVQEHYLLSVFAFIVAYIIVAGLSIPGAEILTLGGGFLYGVLLTTLYVNIGATLGAALAFLSARYLAGNWLQKKYERQLSVLNDEIDKNGARTCLLFDLSPCSPFF